MKSLNQNSKASRNSIVSILILSLSFLLFIFLNKHKLFQRFDPGVVNRYLRSQDILDNSDKIKDRIFVSDEEIYIASGYLYANGAKPTDYNFQHPPFIKYLFGLSVKYFNLPLLPNIIFSGLLILEIYLLGKLIFKSELIGLLSSILLIFDPVFKEVTTYALLDLGQMVFILGFVIMSLYYRETASFAYKKHYVGQGVLLGLAMASKFYSPVIIFLGIIYLYKFASKQFNLKHEFLVIMYAFLIFSICYIKSGSIFNLFFEQAKIIKFMLDHNHAVWWGGVLKMFFGGYIIWPILFFVSLYQLFKTNYKNIQFLIYLLPLIYILIMCFQLPFTRYFILILPFFYLSISNFVVTKILKTT